MVGSPMVSLGQRHDDANHKARRVSVHHDMISPRRPLCIDSYATSCELLGPTCQAHASFGGANALARLQQWKAPTARQGSTDAVWISFA